MRAGEAPGWAHGAGDRGENRDAGRTCEVRRRQSRIQDAPSRVEEEPTRLPGSGQDPWRASRRRPAQRLGRGRGSLRIIQGCIEGIDHFEIQGIHIGLVRRWGLRVLQSLVFAKTRRRTSGSASPAPTFDELEPFCSAVPCAACKNPSGSLAMRFSHSTSRARSLARSSNLNGC